MRRISIAAPLFLLLYGVLRWLGGLDGNRRKDDVAWIAGHISFLIAMVLFGVLAVLLARRTVAGGRLAKVAAAAAVLGAACFVWVILDDLHTGVPSLPSPLTIGGPLLFVLGLVVLLGLQVAAGRAPVWSPVLFFVAYAAISLNLDLLPPAALLILGATAPLARPAATPPRAIRAGSRSR